MSQQQQQQQQQDTTPQKLSYADFLSQERARAALQHGLFSDVTLAYPALCPDPGDVRWPFLHPQHARAFHVRLAKEVQPNTAEPPYFAVGTVVLVQGDAVPYVVCGANVTALDDRLTDVLYSLLPISHAKGASRRILREARMHECTVISDDVVGYRHWIGPFHLTLSVKGGGGGGADGGLSAFTSATTTRIVPDSLDASVLFHLLHEPSIAVPVPLVVRSSSFGMQPRLSIQFMLVGVGPSSEFWIQSFSRGLITHLIYLCDYPPVAEAMKKALEARVHASPTLDSFPGMVCATPSKIAIQDTRDLDRMELQTVDLQSTNWGVARMRGMDAVRKSLTRTVLPRERHVQRHQNGLNHTTYHQEGMLSVVTRALCMCHVDIVRRVLDFLIAEKDRVDVPHVDKHMAWSSPFSRQPRHVTHTRAQEEADLRKPSVALSVLTGATASVQTVITMMLGAIHHDRLGIVCTRVSAFFRAQDR